MAARWATPCTALGDLPEERREAGLSRLLMLRANGLSADDVQSLSG